MLLCPGLFYVLSCVFFLQVLSVSKYFFASVATCNYKNWTLKATLEPNKAKKEMVDFAKPAQHDNHDNRLSINWLKAFKSNFEFLYGKIFRFLRNTIPKSSFLKFDGILNFIDLNRKTLKSAKMTKIRFVYIQIREDLWCLYREFSKY